MMMVKLELNRDKSMKRRKGKKSLINFFKKSVKNTEAYVRED